MHSRTCWLGARVVTLFLVPTAIGLGGLASSCGEDEKPLDLSAASTGAGGTAGSGGAGGAGAAAANGVVSQSSDSVLETDPRLAVDEGGRIGIVWTGMSADGIGHVGYIFSSDGGSTWSPIARLLPPDDQTYASADIAVDILGTFYLTFLSYARDASGGTVLFTRVTEGNDAFGVPAPVTDPAMVGFYDRPRVASIRGGTRVVTFTQLVDQGSQVIAAASEDGETWSQVALAGGGNDDAFHPYPCASPATVMGANPRAWIVFTQQGRVFIRRSEDGGVGWGDGSQVSIDGEDIGKLPTCVAASDDELWVAYGIRDGSKKFGPLKTIKVAHSIDGGASWVDYIDAQDTEAAQVFVIPQIAVESRGTTAHLAYYAGAGHGDAVASLRRAQWNGPMPDAGMPADGGNPGLPSEIIRAPLELSLSRAAPRFLGDSLGFVASGGKLYAASVDNSGTEAHVAFDRITP